jgi:uncharacterized protein YndB with AHSA1/START domain
MMAKAVFTIDENKLEVTISRVFDASRERLWQAQIDPVQIAQWWGPRAYKLTIEKLETSVGGKWRMRHLDTESNEHWFNGEYKELVEPEKIVRTFNYEPHPEFVMTETVHFEALPDGKTKQIAVTHFPSIEALKGMTGSGMEWGATESLERLAELVA